MRSGAAHGVGQARLCEGDACRGRPSGPRPAMPAMRGRRLCRPCHGRLAGGLGLLPGLYAECEQLLGGGPARQPAERTAGGSPSGLPFNSAAADVRTDIVKTLSSWCGLVVDQRRVSAPARTVAALAAFLALHADWLSGHPAAADLSREVARLVRGAHRVTRAEPVRDVRIGTCVVQGCRGVLRAAVRGSRPAQPLEIHCTEDVRHVWAGQQWTQLSRLLESGPESVGRSAERARWLTAADISRLWSTPVGTVYRLANERRWRRQSRAGRTYYSEPDVRAWFDRKVSKKGDVKM